MSMTRKSFRHFTARASIDYGRNSKSLEDCLSVTQAPMKSIEEEYNRALDEGRDGGKVIKMLRTSDRRPPAYFVYNTTQSSEGSPRRIDVQVKHQVKIKRRSKEALRDLGRQLEAAD